MRKTTYWLLPLLVLLLALTGYSQLQVPGPDNTPKIGEKPPDFELSQGRGGTLGMKDFTGKKKVLLAFFPMAFTAG
ncbi:MAG: hypothetical protein DMG14_22420 [Acidobacteria bacterium]|nr:MAG: hypothetical protein DMG14_22420 [Acidobacteriota bacterium]